MCVGICNEVKVNMAEITWKHWKLPETYVMNAAVKVCFIFSKLNSQKIFSQEYFRQNSLNTK